jgi:hypothetical protein
MWKQRHCAAPSAKQRLAERKQCEAQCKLSNSGRIEKRANIPAAEVTPAQRARRQLRLLCHSVLRVLSCWCMRAFAMLASNRVPTQGHAPRRGCRRAKKQHGPKINSELSKRRSHCTGGLVNVKNNCFCHYVLLAQSADRHE